MEVEHDAWEKVRWKFYEDQKECAERERQKKTYGLGVHDGFEKKT